MRRDIGAIYTGSWSFARAAPLVFLLPAVPELVQHAAEWHLGMYASTAAFRAASASAERMGPGFIKAVALLLPGYWLVRYMAWGDARRAVRPEAAGLLPWLAVFAFGVASTALGLFAPSLHHLIGLPGGRAAALADAGAHLAAGVLGLYVTAWGVAAPLGDTALTPLRSLSVMAGSFWRTVGYMLAGTAPLMIVHYGLGLGAIGRPGWLAATMLAADGLVVALLAHTMAGASFVAARAALARQGESLPVSGGAPASPLPA